MLPLCWRHPRSGASVLTAECSAAASGRQAGAPPSGGARAEGVRGVASRQAGGLRRQLPGAAHPSARWCRPWRCLPRPRGRASRDLRCQTSRHPHGRPEFFLGGGEGIWAVVQDPLCAAEGRGGAWSSLSPAEAGRSSVPAGSSTPAPAQRLALLKQPTAAPAAGNCERSPCSSRRSSPWRWLRGHCSSRP